MEEWPGAGRAPSAELRGWWAMQRGLPHPLAALQMEGRPEEGLPSFGSPLTWGALGGIRTGMGGGGVWPWIGGSGPRRHRPLI